MTCEGCGCILGPDDEIDYTGGRRGVTRPVKVLCPNCDHIQYGRYMDFEEDTETREPGDEYFDEGCGD
jgi:RNase P subunit RPR2